MKYDYSFKESLDSLAPIVEKTYLALDSGTDSTESEVRKLPNIQIVPSVWDMSLQKGLVLSVETNKALEALRTDHGSESNAWGVYLQADEVLHEDDYEILKRDIEKAKTIQIGFLAIDKYGNHGAFALQKGFSYAIRSENQEELIAGDSYFNS